jgi:hypothetical protein
VAEAVAEAVAEEAASEELVAEVQETPPEPVAEQTVADGDFDAPTPVPSYESSPSELPPLTLAPGPLLFDGDETPIVGSGSYDAVEEAPAELTDLIPADFTDLIPKDIVLGDLARHADADAPAAETEQAEALPEPVVEPVAEQAPSTDELPPMDVAEIPSDVSSIELLEAAPIPAARETHEEPVPSSSHREGPRGLGYFGG